MNFGFYIYGFLDSYNQYPFDNNGVDFKEFAQNSTAESLLTVCRRGQLVYYAFMRRLEEKSNYYLGFCLVFNGIYCHKPKEFFLLFERAFDDVLMKGELLKFERGKCLYTIGKFAEKTAEIERIKTFFRNSMEDGFYRNFSALSSAFKIGNGSKTISIKESVSEIRSTIAEYDCVHISSNEKSLSELERSHKMLTDLYSEKQEMENKYRKLLAQKKQYKAVLFLCFAVIACAVVLFAFNKNIQSKDSQIKELNEKVFRQQSDITILNANIADLNIRNRNLTVENSRLSDKLNRVSEEKERLSSKNNSLFLENEQLTHKNSSLMSKISTLESQIPVRYVTTSKSEIYHRKYDNFEYYEKANIFYFPDKVIMIYKVNDGYGLSEYGWLEMSKLKKYY
ncbi:MAG: hypothetical protein LBH32_13810 [Dysgonamonadaceae bacterium]|jgi:chromosome segregation ATPase|nr:hypothetical protein [Dysgonamonadaceae bacterium]